VLCLCLYTFIDKVIDIRQTDIWSDRYIDRQTGIDTFFLHTCIYVYVCRQQRTSRVQNLLIKLRSSFILLVFLFFALSRHDAEAVMFRQETSLYIYTRIHVYTAVPFSSIFFMFF
jgi:hypothetical protein